MLINQIDQDLIEAIKEKNESKTSVLRMLKAAIHNWQIANQKEPSESDILSVIQKEIKSRKDAIGLYKQGNRQELASKEENEIQILEKYLPEQMSEKEIRTKVQEMIKSSGANSIQDMGKVMGPLMAEFKGKADGSLVSGIVKEELTK